SVVPRVVQKEARNSSRLASLTSSSRRAIAKAAVFAWIVFRDFHASGGPSGSRVTILPQIRALFLQMFSGFIFLFFPSTFVVVSRKRKARSWYSPLRTCIFHSLSSISE